MSLDPNNEVVRETMRIKEDCCYMSLDPNNEVVRMLLYESGSA